MSRKPWYMNRPRTGRSPSTYSAIPPTPPIEAYDDRCNDIRELDEVYCSTCGLRWDANEDKPTCPRIRR